MDNKQQSKIKWSELSEDQKNEIAILVAKNWIELQKKLHIEMMEDIFTPFWVRWWRNFKKKYGSNNEQQNNLIIKN